MSGFMSNQMLSLTWFTKRPFNNGHMHELHHDMSVYRARKIANIRTLDRIFLISDVGYSTHQWPRNGNWPWPTHGLVSTIRDCPNVQIPPSLGGYW